MNRKKVRRLVVKVGSSLLTREEGLLDQERLARLARELAAVRRNGTQVILVSSGAIAAGMGELNWKKRPSELSRKQAAAAVGQPRLMESYRHFFRHEGIRVAQMLVTREDFERPARRQNIHTTFETLLKEGVIPVVNENDTVAVEEIRLGDNDTLAARVAMNAKADLLVLLTDVEGLMTRPPHHGGGEILHQIPRITARIEALAHGKPGTNRGTGGMMTKIQAARLATRAGIPVVVASGHVPGVLQRVVAGETAGTRFLA